MLKKSLYAVSIVVIFLSLMRVPPLSIILRQVSNMAKEVKVEPYSMAFVTAPNKEVAKTLAGGLGNFFIIYIMYVLILKHMYSLILDMFLKK